MKVAEKWGIDVIEKYGIDVDDAVQKALEDLHVSRDEVRITVLEKPTKGFLGIGSKLALVRVECKYVGNTYNVKDKQPILDGVWFEQTEFYDICKENGVENLENAFYLKKANQMKIDSEKKISNTKERKRAEYIEKARISISNIEKDEKEKADKKLKSIESFYKDKSQKIQKIYRENKEKLVQEVVDIVIKK